jgi:hypothetical protein
MRKLPKIEIKLSGEYVRGEGICGIIGAIITVILLAYRFAVIGHFLSGLLN